MTLALLRAPGGEAMTDKETERIKADLRRTAEGSCLCLGYPPPCESCTAHAALRAIERLEKKLDARS